MGDYQFELAKRGKWICPACKRKTFVLYVDKRTGKPVHTTVGLCDRADNCRHHYTPHEYFRDNHISLETKKGFSAFLRKTANPQTKPPPSFIDATVFNRSLAGYEQNSFFKWLSGIVGIEKASGTVSRYHAGCSKSGGIVFWQMDLQGRIRTGKIIHYGDDGHRRKDVTPPVQWVHSIMKLPDFNLCQCLFGEHLLADKNKPVAIVESEKTAILASVYLPGIIWLASGGSDGLNAEKCTVLKSRNVILYPDCGQYDKWTSKAKTLSKETGAPISVSDLIERCATAEESKSGFDLADYLIRYRPEDFLPCRNPELFSMKHQAGRLCELETNPTPGQNILIDDEIIEPDTHDIQPDTTPFTSSAFVSGDGKLYIPGQLYHHNFFSIYPSINDFNKRLKLPEIVPYQSVCTTNMTQIDNLKTILK